MGTFRRVTLWTALAFVLVMLLVVTAKLLLEPKPAPLQAITRVPTEPTPEPTTTPEGDLPLPAPTPVDDVTRKHHQALLEYRIEYLIATHVGYYEYGLATTRRRGRGYDLIARHRMRFSLADKSGVRRFLEPWVVEHNGSLVLGSIQRITLAGPHGSIWVDLDSIGRITPQ